MKTNLVVQSNKLVEAHYKQKYTVQEQRMVLWLISEIHKENYKESYFKGVKTSCISISISAQKYAEMLDIRVSDVYKRAQRIGEALMQKVIKINTETGWEMFNWLCYMEYKSGQITAEMVKGILPYITDLKEKFTSFKLENILYLRSSHAIKLYQILSQYKQIGERKIKVDELRLVLGIWDIKTYRLFGDIRKKILEISKREINAKTDLTISYSTIKQSRKVVAIKFKITQKPNQEIQARKEFEKHILQLPNENTLKAIFEKYGFKQTVVKNSFKEFLNEKISNYDPQSSKPIKLKNIS